MWIWLYGIMSLLLELMKSDSTGPLDPAGQGKSGARAIWGPSSLSIMRRSPACTLRSGTLLSSKPTGNWWKCRITNWKQRDHCEGSKKITICFLLIWRTARLVYHNTDCRGHERILHATMYYSYQHVSSKCRQKKTDWAGVDHQSYYKFCYLIHSRFKMYTFFVFFTLI